MNFKANLYKTLCLAAILGAIYSHVDQALAQANYQGKAAVTQITSATTGVTANAPSVVITTVSLTNAVNTDIAFVLTDSAIEANSDIQATVDGYSGTVVTNGMPYAYITGISAGSCTVHVCNVHPANALSGTVKVGVNAVN